MKDWFLESVWFTDSFNGLLKRSIDLFTFYGVLLNVFSLVNNLLFVAVSKTESWFYISFGLFFIKLNLLKSIYLDFGFLYYKSVDLFSLSADYA